MPSPALLDTDILSAVMRRDPAVFGRARSYLGAFGELTFSVVTQYEILRGLRHKGAARQIHDFEQLCRESHILPLTQEIATKAAEIHAHLKGRGTMIQDADILIAASARVHGLVVATNNETHYRRVPRLQIDNWLK